MRKYQNKQEQQNPMGIALKWISYNCNAYKTNHLQDYFNKIEQRQYRFRVEVDVITVASLDSIIH